MGEISGTYSLFEGVLRLIKPNFNGTIWRKIPMEALYSIPFWFGVFLINLAAIFSCFMLKYSVFLINKFLLAVISIDVSFQSIFLTVFVFTVSVKYRSESFLLGMLIKMRVV